MSPSDRDRAEVASAITSLTSLMTHLQTSLQQNVGDIRDAVDSVKRDLESVNHKVTQLATEMEPVSKAFKPDGLRPALDTRQALVEEKVKTIENKLAVAAAQRWQVWLALIVAAIGLISSLAMLLAKLATSYYHGGPP